MEEIGYNKADFEVLGEITVHHAELIVMLTHHDKTVANAREVFESCRHSKAKFFGMKEVGLPLEDMKALYADMRASGKTTVLEVVAYTEEECLRGAEIAAECGCSILMGTLFFDSILQFCRDHSILYMPFVGTVEERPSVLKGDIGDIVRQAQGYIEKGCYGVDLLGYRYTGDAVALIQALLAGLDAPVCVAGSINSYARLEEVKAAAPWSFTVGGALFENRFDGSFAEQIDKICDYMAPSRELSHA